MTIFKNTKEITLTPQRVIEARKLYFIEEWTYVRIADFLSISDSLVRKAIQGHGGYSAIEDDIPQEKKDKRIPARIRYPSRKHEQRKFKEMAKRLRGANRSYL